MGNDACKRLFKSLQLLLLLGFWLGTQAVQAQTPVSASAIPDEIRDDFKLRFNGANKVVWFKDGAAYYGVRFKMLDKKVEAVYQARDRRWTQTVEPVTYEEFPDAARYYVESYFPEHQKKASKKVATRSYGILYEIVVGKDLHAVELAFDMNGKLIREDSVVLEPDSVMDTEAGEEETKRPKAKLKNLFGK